MTEYGEDMNREDIQHEIAKACAKMHEAIWPSERMYYADLIAKLEKQIEEND